MADEFAQEERGLCIAILRIVFLISLIVGSVGESSLTVPMGWVGGYFAKVLTILVYIVTSRTLDLNKLMGISYRLEVRRLATSLIREAYTSVILKREAQRVRKGNWRSCIALHTSHANKNFPIQLTILA